MTSVDEELVLAGDKLADFGKDLDQLWVGGHLFALFFDVRIGHVFLISGDRCSAAPQHQGQATSPAPRLRSETRGGQIDKPRRHRLCCSWISSPLSRHGIPKGETCR